MSTKNRDEDRKPLDESCAQLLSLVRMMGLDHVCLSVSAAGHVTIFASSKDEPEDQEPAWQVTAQVGPTSNPNWSDAPGPTDAIRESSRAIGELSRARRGLLTAEERRAKMKIVQGGRQ